MVRKLTPTPVYAIRAATSALSDVSPATINGMPYRTRVRTAVTAVGDHDVDVRQEGLIRQPLRDEHVGWQVGALDRSTVVATTTTSVPSKAATVGPINRSWSWLSKVPWVT